MTVVKPPALGPRVSVAGLTLGTPPRPALALKVKVLVTRPVFCTLTRKVTVWLLGEAGAILLCVALPGSTGLMLLVVTVTLRAP